ncbi:MAG TPA: AAA family ATPase [Verrucomicrobiae bacterium]|nr:AAA family ATPase [Verrucomicrobiae bacterium]
MIGPLRIQNFKSIRDLKFNARRVNLFIGEPNVGKSNILEALSLLSPRALESLGDIVRFATVPDLFFDQDTKLTIRVWADNLRLAIARLGAGFQGEIREGGKDTLCGFSLDHSRVTGSGGVGLGRPDNIRCYKFKAIHQFVDAHPELLHAPFGDNIVAVLYANPELRRRIGGLVRTKGFRLQLKPTESQLLVTKDINDELYSYPWVTVSETLRRVVFFMTAMETNREAALLLDEPETCVFPFYTKYLADRIAQEESNQYFITTHNPYLLSNIVEKTAAKDLAVFVVRMENCETGVKQVPESNIPELLRPDADSFVNFDRLVVEETRSGVTLK